MKKRIADNLPITAVLLVAGVMRFWDFCDIPFSHDELSAINRAMVASWSELVEAVRADSHPIGVEMLIAAIGKLLGFNSFWIKLPFAICGVWSVWLIYLVGKKINSEQTGLIAAALLATAQYAITFSQWARPYSIGLLGVLWVAWALIKIKSDRNQISTFVHLAFAVAFCGYVHYFALLQAIVLVVSFLPFLDKRGKVLLTAAGFLSFLIWLPHLFITLLHFSRGGLGVWLQAPASDYWLTLLAYTFHFSPFVPVLLGLAALPFLLKSREWVGSYWPYYLLLNTIVPYIIAYVYSVNINPVLHQSVMLFSVPFLFLCIGYFVRLPRPVFLIVLSAAAIINISTLVFGRDHYQINYSSAYGTALNWLHQLERAQGRVVNVVDLRPDLVEMMFDQHLAPRSNVQLGAPLIESKKLEAFLDSTQADRMFLAVTNGSYPEVFAAALEHYPCIEEARYFYAGAAYLLGKDCESRQPMPGTIVDEGVFPETPYSSSLEWNWSELDPNTDIHFVLDHRGVLRNAMTVVEANTENFNYWRGVQLDEFRSPGRLHQHAYHVFYRSEIDMPSDARLKSYVWLAEGGGVQVFEFRAYAVPKNPNKFRLFEEP